MKRIGLFVLILSAIGCLVPVIRDAGAQRRYYDAPRGLYTQQLIRRVASLERRLDRLENLLPEDAPQLTTVTVETAQRKVASAADRLSYSEELFRKGYISQVQLDAERFEYARAQKVLDFAEAVRDGKPTERIENEIEILDAEHDLNVAARQLNVVKRMVASGLMQPTTLDGYRTTLAAAETRLATAKSQAAEQ